MYQIQNRDGLIFYVYEIQHGKPIGFEWETTREGDPHHALIHDTKYNRKTYPLLIDNPLNIYMFTRGFHNANQNWGLITDMQVIDCIECWLRDFKYTIENDDTVEITVLIREFSEGLIYEIEKYDKELLKNKLFFERIPHAFNYIAQLWR